jgi:hypothetical protein
MAKKEGRRMEDKEDAATGQFPSGMTEHNFLMRKVPNYTPYELIYFWTMHVPDVYC